MSRWHGLDIEAEGTGISKPLSKQVNLLGTMVGQVVAEQMGDDMLDLVESLRLRCKQADQEGDPALRDDVKATVDGLEHRKVVQLLHIFTTFFHLVNIRDELVVVVEEPTVPAPIQRRGEADHTRRTDGPTL